MVEWKQTIHNLNIVISKKIEILKQTQAEIKMELKTQNIINVLEIVLQEEQIKYKIECQYLKIR